VALVPAVKRFNRLLFHDSYIRPAASTMELDIRRVINDLRLFAFATSDPGKRERVLKIIDRISNQEAWPDEDEIISLRLKFIIS
jgi:hypothetical protein